MGERTPVASIRLWLRFYEFTPLVKAIHVLAVPDGLDLHTLAAIPYSFTTMWLAVRGAGLTRENAAGKNVLIHGAAGGLGTLATQILSAWGVRVTAIARKSNGKVCLEAGATEVVERTDKLFVSLARSFDATLNFATWEDDLALLGCLRDVRFCYLTRTVETLGAARRGAHQGCIAHQSVHPADMVDLEKTKTSQR